LTAAEIGSGPPRPTLALNVGITGHRAHAFDIALIPELNERLRDVLGRLREAVDEAHLSSAEYFSRAQPVLRLHTALASGADQLAATAARELRYEVRAMLPFPTDEYERDFTDRVDHRIYCQQLGAVDGYFALPGKREAQEDAYVMVGKAVIAAADVLVALWDGHPANGPGGTAHVVDLALRAGVPVVHIPLSFDGTQLAPTRLLKGGEALDPVVASLRGQADYEELVEAVLLPKEEMALDQLELFFKEDCHPTNWRIEYPALLASLGIKSLAARPWRQTPLDQALAEHATGDRYDPGPQRLAYEWANFLAIRYAQLFRSGHVTSYMLSSFAVLLALSGLILPSIKPLLVLAELWVLGLLFINTRLGSRGAWHRRWLQYRHLAETLRSLSYLKQTGLVAPPWRDLSLSHTHSRHAVGDWTRWYSAAIWREMPSTEGLLDEAAVHALAEDVRQRHVAGQISYHRLNAQRMHLLDHRLHLVGEVIMSAVILACALFLILSMFAKPLLTGLTPLFIFVTAGFPVLGAAVFGLRGHGEHLLAASRSASTANALAVNYERLAQIDAIDALALELNQTAEITLSDLNEWTVAYSQRQLQVPG
jgi:hypothetical protein